MHRSQCGTSTYCSDGEHCCYNSAGYPSGCCENGYTCDEVSGTCDSATGSSKAGKAAVRLAANVSVKGAVKDQCGPSTYSGFWE